MDCFAANEMVGYISTKLCSQASEKQFSDQFSGFLLIFFSYLGFRGFSFEIHEFNILGMDTKSVLKGILKVNGFVSRPHVPEM